MTPFWKFFICLALVGLIALVAGDKFRRDGKVRAELHQAAADARQASTWEVTNGRRGQVAPEVIAECGQLEAKLERYRSPWWTDDDDFTAYAESCSPALRGAAHFYIGLGGEYGCGQAKRALEAYRGGGVLELGDAVGRCR